MNWRETLIAVPLIIMVFWIGIYPGTFIDKIEPSVEKVIETVRAKAQIEKSDFESYQPSMETSPAVEESEEMEWDSTGH